jgi:DNA-binding CsgD family transcriptional regulator
VLIVGDGFGVDMAAALVMAAKGARYRVTPDMPVILTPAEQRMLRLLAYGQSNQQIAEQIPMQPQTVKNTLTMIYKKLGVRSRTQAVLYYWSIWQMVARRSPSTTARYPGHVN